MTKIHLRELTEEVQNFLCQDPTFFKRYVEYI